mmetsp:Transcript_56407/g.168829  ORF Transcript_56407/g.168829 Transcript_56407/m.168829 type:complete len:398 (-) Transcript_56407:104-1297(-)
MAWVAPPFVNLEEAVQNPSLPIGMRMRAAYFLRQAYDNAVRNRDPDDRVDRGRDPAEAAIRALSAGLLDRRHGSLLRHEFAYVMGQLRDERCCPPLESILSDGSDCVMVRHECGEALGAIGAERSVPVLEAAVEANRGSPEIGDTCELSLAHMRWRIAGDSPQGKAERGEEPAACACMLTPYNSVDPAPPHPSHVDVPTEELGSLLRDSSKPLFERYRAMFSLRNRGGSDAVEELGRTLVCDESSALLRHEVAYVLGQMQHPASLEFLDESLRRSGEHAMVRHEAAEALGAIEDRWEECERVLKEFLCDPDVVVRESCIVALDAADYWGKRPEADIEGDKEQIGGLVDDKEVGGALPSFVQQKALESGKGDRERCRTNEVGNIARGRTDSHFNVVSS